MEITEIVKGITERVYWACVNSDTDVIESIVGNRKNLEQHTVYDKPVILTEQDVENINRPRKIGLPIEYKYSQMRHSLD
jgi:hypothetical protein